MEAIRLGLASSVSLGILSSPALAQTSAVEFSPTEAWSVDGDEHSCALRRQFADSDGRVVQFELRQFAPYAPGSEFRFLVHSADVARRYEVVSLRLEPHAEAIEMESAMSVTVGEGDRGFRFDFDYLPVDERLDMAQLGELPFVYIGDEALAGVSILTGFEDELLLSTGPLVEPQQLLQPCYDRLLQSWDVDSSAHRALSRPAKPHDIEDWVRQIVSQYPYNLLIQGAGASVHIRLMIDTQGEPDSCHAISVSGHEGFRDFACNILMRHGQFEPALDAEGNPVRSYWTTTIHYQMDR